MVMVIVGDANADLLVMADHYPLPGDDALVRALDWSSGGAGVNTAVAAQRLTGDVRLVTRVGNDAAAGLALARLPPTVPALRIAQPPVWPAARASMG